MPTQLGIFGIAPVYSVHPSDRLDWVLCIIAGEAIFPLRIF